MHDWQDLRSTFFLLIGSCFFGIICFLDLQSLAWWQYFLLLFLGGFFCWNVSIINHNHRHHAIFKNKFLNRLTDLWISILQGFPSTRMHLVHVYNHHQFYPSTQDWSHAFINAKGKGFWRLLTYLKNATLRMAQGRLSLVDTIKKERSLKEEQIALAGMMLTYGLINLKIFLFLIVPVWILGLFLLMSTNLLNHDDCPQEESVNNSRDFVSSIENFLLFNVGYHSAHHEKPSLHWSKLRNFHETHIAPRKDPRYIQSSLLSYFIRTLFQFKIQG